MKIVAIITAIDKIQGFRVTISIGNLYEDNHNIRILGTINSQLTIAYLLKSSSVHLRIKALNINSNMKEWAREQ